MVRSICPFRLISSRTFRNFGLNGKHPGLNCNRSTDIFRSKLYLRIKPTKRIFLTVTNLILSCNSPLFESVGNWSRYVPSTPFWDRYWGRAGQPLTILSLSLLQSQRSLRNLTQSNCLLVSKVVNVLHL